MNNGGLLLHLFGFVNGLSASTLLIMLFFSIAYAYKKKFQNAHLVFLIALLMGGFLCFSLYTQNAIGLSKNSVLPSFLVSIGQYSSAFSMMLILYTQSKSLANHSTKTYLFVKKNQPFVYIGYCIAFAFGLALIFADTAILVIVLNNLLYLIFTVISYLFIQNNRDVFGNNIGIKIFYGIVVLNIIFSVYLFYDMHHVAKLFYLINHFAFSLLMLMYCFVVIRYGESESEKYHFLKTDLEYDIAMSFKKSLTNGELFLVYQPKLDLSNNVISGVEALIRWQHPSNGMISPAKFIPIAEKSGMIQDLCFWVLDAAIKQAADFKRNKLFIPIAINFSTENLTPTVIQYLKKRLTEYKISPQLIQIEITETLFLEIDEHRKQAIDMLKELGVNLSMDDYGTGYSSLSYLQQLPLKELKIDATFIKDLDIRSDNKVIVDSVIQMSTALNLVVTAEGVETNSVKSILEELGCHMIQGYLLTKPVPIPVLMQWILDNDYKVKSI